jgi:hypothetical protein
MIVDFDSGGGGGRLQVTVWHAGSLLPTGLGGGPLSGGLLELDAAMGVLCLSGVTGGGWPRGAGELRYALCCTAAETPATPTPRPS